MGYEERKGIIEKIETLRKSKVITYVITTRPKINTMMDTKDLRVIYDHLENNSKSKYDKTYTLSTLLRENIDALRELGKSK